MRAADHKAVKAMVAGRQARVTESVLTKRIGWKAGEVVTHHRIVENGVASAACYALDGLLVSGAGARITCPDCAEYRETQ